MEKDLNKYVYCEIGASLIIENPEARKATN